MKFCVTAQVTAHYTGPKGKRGIVIVELNNSGVFNSSFIRCF